MVQSTLDCCFYEPRENKLVVVVCFSTYAAGQRRERIKQEEEVDTLFDKESKEFLDVDVMTSSAEQGGDGHPSMSGHPKAFLRGRFAKLRQLTSDKKYKKIQN